MLAIKYLPVIMWVVLLCCHAPNPIHVATSKDETKINSWTLLRVLNSFLFAKAKNIIFIWKKLRSFTRTAFSFFDSACGDLQKRPERGTAESFSMSTWVGVKLPEARQIQFLDICPCTEPLGLDRRAVILKADYISILHHPWANVESLCVCVCFLSPQGEARRLQCRSLVI